jgi:predicted RNA-binding Zn ribbon-like protein
MPKRSDDKDPPWKEGFLFVGNHFALDFLNTRPVLEGNPTELLSDFAALLRWYCAAGLMKQRHAAHLQQRWGRSAAARHALEAMWEFRVKLRKEILRWEDGGEVRHSFIDELNHLMAEHPMRTRLTGAGSKPSTELYFESRNVEDLFAPLAHSAAILLAGANRERVRKCGQCVLHFLDTSKKGTRRWCSMQLCGNRLKVAAYAARRRSSSERSA